MKNVSEKYLEKMQDGIRTFTPRMTIAGVEIDGDVQAGMTINLGSCGSEQFAIGNAYIPYITATISGCTQKLQDKEILLEMGLVMDDGTVEYKNMGYFTVEKPLADKFQTSFTAYGRLMSKAGGDYTSNLTYPAPIASVLNEIKSQTGLNIILNGLTASDNIEKPIVGELHREALMRIAGLLGGFVTENGDGEIVISKYTLNKAVSVDLDFCYTYPETYDEKYTVTGISVVVTEDTTDEDGKPVEGEAYASDSDINVSVYNPYMTASLFNACESNIVGFSYMPTNIEFLGDIRLEPWDSIVLTDIDPETGIDALGIDVPCMEIVHTWDGGLVTTITAPGSTATETASAFGGPMSTRVERLYQKMLNTPSKSDISRVKSEIEKQMQTLTDNIIGKNGGYFFITYDDNGMPTGWIIMDTPVLTDDTKMWIMSQGGLGFSEDGGKTVSKLAFDMEGNFYADCIMSKSVTAEKIDVVDLFAQNIVAAGSVTGLKFISQGIDDYGYAAEMVLDAGELHLVAGDGLLEDGSYAYTFHTDVAAHDIELSYDAPDMLNRLLMNGNLVEHTFMNKETNETVVVFKSTSDGVKVSSVDIDKGVTGNSERLMYNGKPLALYSDLISIDPEEPTEPQVTSVNGKVGDIVLSASDVGARPNTWTPSASDVGADPSGTAASAVSGHNTSTEAHNDMRLLIEGLTTRLNTLANSDDTTLDQMAEVVAYIKSNRTLIESVTTEKVSVDDIVNNLATNLANKPLSAAQGVVLKKLIDAITVPTKTSQLTNDSDFMSATEVASKINEAISGIAGGLKFEVIDEIDTSTPGDSNTIYLVKSEHSDLNGAQYFDEYMFIESLGKWEKIGDTQVSLANYYTQSQVDTFIYNIQKSIPTYISQLYNDKGYITAEDLETGEATWDKLKGNILETIETPITWDGNTEAREMHPKWTTYYKVSDLVITAEDAVGLRYKTTKWDSYSTIPPIGTGFASTIDNGKMWMCLWGVMCVYDESEGCPTGIYFYKGTFDDGTTDEHYIAEFILEADKVKPELLPDNLSADMSEYFETVGGDTITWDGNIDGRYNALGMAYHVSDATPTLEDLQRGGTFLHCSGNAFTFTAEQVIDVEAAGMGSGCYLIVSEVNTPLAIVVYEENSSLTIEYNGQVLTAQSEKLGVLFGYGSDTDYVKSMTINGYTGFNKKEVLKNEHLNIFETVGTDTLTWDGNREGLINCLETIYRVSDIIPTLEELSSGGSITVSVTDFKRKLYFSETSVFDFERWAIGEGCYGIVVGSVPLVLVATKENATLNYPIGDTTINVVVEKPGVYFIYDTYGNIGDPGTRVNSFTINGYKGFKKEAIKGEHMPSVDGTIKAKVCGKPSTAWEWLNENYGKKFVKIHVTDYGGEHGYDWTFEKVTKETGDGSDGYTVYPSDNAVTGLSTDYYAFHSTKIGNVTANGTSINFLRGGLYYTSFFIREGSFSIGTEGTSWLYDTNATNNKININNPGAEDTGFEIVFYYLEE